MARLIEEFNTVLRQFLRTRVKFETSRLDHKIKKLEKDKDKIIRKEVLKDLNKRK